MAALRFWFKLGWVSFGGPAGQIAIMHRELVDERRWISEGRFLHALNYCMLLPGPEAQQLATYIGWLLHGTRGGIAAGLLFVLPSLAILIALSWIYMAFGEVPLVAGVFYGLKPAVVALVAHAGLRIGKRVLKNPLAWVVAIAAFIATFAFALPFPLIIATAALAGWLSSRSTKAGADAAHATTANDAKLAPRESHAVIDDDTPTPPHALFSRSRLALVAVTGVVLWSTALALLAAQGGVAGTLTQLGWFFTKAALLTFGGAYAVLPYVNDAAVQHYHWLTAAQMIDGLALGETTPGPLIMVVAFVGFVAAWKDAVLGSDLRVLGAVLGAATATYFTFLPSFVLVLGGGPVIESTRGHLRLAAALATVSAAVVGVIANLALFFGVHVFWPRGIAAGIDYASVAISAVAVIALVRFRLGVLPLLAGCAVAGVALSYLLR
jgi:chromate transporter